MKVFASVAVTSDDALDDCSPQRLSISSPEDWAEVKRLRAQFDAILVGAATVRRDDPRLVIDDATLRAERCRQEMDSDLVKVTCTRSGCLDPKARFFTCGTGRKIVFSEKPLPQLDGVAEVIVAERITAALMVTELEKRGIGSLFVEGGAAVLRMFFAERLVDTLRLARTAGLYVEDARAPRLDIGTAYLVAPHRTERFGATDVTTYTLRRGLTAADYRYLREAVALSRQCVPSATSYCVGAVAVTCNGRAFRGYTHESSATHHAEQEAVAKALREGADLRGATMYTSMEPCSTRHSEPESCSAMLLRLGFGRVVFALYEPDCFVTCRGALDLRLGGVEVRVVPELGAEVKRINGHLGR